ncbi:UNVERIFIED_CONTAM: hypothetical protein Slati_2019600 [Sesamum latifolium]|uniref:Bifunctional inhibitor/plant lipid transfer protein/seed storage helical domain-containing protein n=1 Tax=Sesamum latifolium TaxID=2727402 RepID=A0AAW2WM20_9LAMI
MVMSRGTAEIQCTDAVTQLLPCEAFLLGGGTTPSAGCCAAVQSLDKIATASQGDRKAYASVSRTLPGLSPLTKAMPSNSLSFVMLTLTSI